MQLGDVLLVFLFSSIDGSHVQRTHWPRSRLQAAGAKPHGVQIQATQPATCPPLAGNLKRSSKTALRSGLRVDTPVGVTRLSRRIRIVEAVDLADPDDRHQHRDLVDEEVGVPRCPLEPRSESIPASAISESDQSVGSCAITLRKTPFTWKTTKSGQRPRAPSSRIEPTQLHAATLRPPCLQGSVKFQTISRTGSLLGGIS